jgi:hypothetical protein
MDCTEDGRRVKVMPIVDEYSRECLTLEMERSITSEGVVDTLRRLFIERGAPDYIRAGLRPRVHREGTKALAGRLWGWHPLHRARFSVGECLLGDVHWQATGRATEQGAIRQSQGGAGTGS